MSDNNPLTRIDTLHYKIEEFDERTGVIGTFAYDPYHHMEYGKYWSVSPVFDSLAQFLRWANDEGFRFFNLGKCEVTLTRVDYRRN